MYGGGYYTSKRVHCSVCSKLQTYSICTDCATKIEAEKERKRPVKVAID